MDFVFIDYSEFYYSDVVKTAMPDKRGGKFVQIRNNDTEYLVFSPRELTPFHSNIVERFCAEQAIRGLYNDEKKRFEIKAQGWTIAGGGKFEIDRTTRRLRLYDDSMSYGKFDARGLTEKISEIEGLSGYEVSIT